MVKGVLVIAVAVVLLAGCGGIRKGIRQISEQNKKNFILAEDLTIDLYEIYPQISGAFEASKHLLPPPITDRVLIIDQIMLVKDVKSISKQKRAEAGTHFLFLLGDSAQLAYKAFAPDVLNLLKLMGLL